MSWYAVAKRATWTCLRDVRVNYPTADLIDKLLVFNIGRNRWRLIVRTNFRGQRLFIKAVLTHDQYNRGDWKRWND